MLPTLRMEWGTDATFTAPDNARKGTLVFTDDKGNECRESLNVVNGEFTITTECSCRMCNFLVNRRSAEAKVLWSRGRRQTLYIHGSCHGY